MEQITWPALVGVILLLVALCSLASFYYGRKKAISEEAQQDGSLKTDIRYIKETMRDTTKSLDALSMKLDASDKSREQDYRSLLVQLTELKSSYKSLHIRVDELNRRVDEYHHP